MTPKDIQTTPRHSHPVFCAGGERGMGAGESRSLRAATLTHLDINAELWEQIQCEDIANVQV